MTDGSKKVTVEALESLVNKIYESCARIAEGAAIDRRSSGSWPDTIAALIRKAGGRIRVEVTPGGFRVTNEGVEVVHRRDDEKKTVGE
jgi:phytoene dehydrogenase-like protein